MRCVRREVVLDRGIGLGNQGIGLGDREAVRHEDEPGVDQVGGGSPRSPSPVGPTSNLTPASRCQSTTPGETALASASLQGLGDDRFTDRRQFADDIRAQIVRREVLLDSALQILHRIASLAQGLMTYRFRITCRQARGKQANRAQIPKS